MASGIQSKLAFRQARLQRKLYSNFLRLAGQKATVVQLTVDEDQFGNRDFVITGQKIITGVISIPGNELTLWNADRTNNTSQGGGTGVMDILPIEAYFQFEDKVEKDDILLYKYLLDPELGEYFLQAFQVVNKIGRLSNTLIWSKYILAKYTLDLESYPELATIISDYKKLEEDGRLQE